MLLRPLALVIAAGLGAAAQGNDTTLGVVVIPWSVISQGGAVAILAGVVWMIVTGRLVPRRALLDAQAERDRWNEAAMKAMQQNNELLTGARVARDVIRALPEATEGSP